MNKKYEKKNLDRLEFSFEIKKIEESNEYYVFSGWGSTFEIDRGDDQVIAGAFKKSLKKIEPILLWQHDSWEPLGVFTKIEERKEGLWLEAKMPKADTFVSGRVYPQMKVGSIKKMSIGFNTISYEMEKIDGKTIRKLTEIELWEVSLVTFPMNAGASIVEVKTAFTYQNLPFPKNENGDIDMDIKWSASEASKRVKKFLDIDEEPSEEYKKAFLCFGECKIQIADIIDEKMYAIPRAIFAASATISGAMGNVKMSESELESVKSNINKYYTKMDKPSPFEKGFSSYIDDFKTVTDLSRFLKDFGFSNNETNSLISAIKLTARNEASSRNENESLDKLCESMISLNKSIKENYNARKC